MSEKKSYQAGSATTFVIIAIILLALLLGGIYYVVQRGDQARKDAEATKIADEQSAAQKAKDEAIAANNAKTNDKPVAPNPTPTSVSDTSTNGKLPATGIEVDVIRIVAMGLLAGTATSFVVSRRGHNRPL